jgi:SAM-dependent methyltransferase
VVVLVSEASAWVRRWTGLLRPGAHVLDLACGSGRNLKGLAAQGFNLTGVDRDAEALEALKPLGEMLHADLEDEAWPLAGRTFDAVVVANYLWRPRWPELRALLSEGGVLIYETFAHGQQFIGRPARPEFLLQPGELLALCQGLHIVAFEDGFEGSPGRFVQRVVAVRETPLPAGAAPAEPARYGLRGPAS